ncbi:MAG: response regulator [Desulfobacterales bacterium]|nr:response regulator [Desulfobacterales bacterium]
MCDILLVEDNRIFRETLYESLVARYPAAKIEAVETGEAALDVTSGDPPKTVLLDISLPGISGLEVAEKMRSRNVPATIVILTGNDYPEYQEAARDRGVEFFISKNTARLDEILSLAGILIGSETPLDRLTEKYRLSPSD